MAVTTRDVIPLSLGVTARISATTAAIHIQRVPVS